MRVGVIGFRCVLVIGVLCASVRSGVSADARSFSRVSPSGQLPEDHRLKPLRNLRDAYHPWSPPESKEAWEQEAARVRKQIQVSLGLWPMPDKQPLKPRFHGVVDRGDYTVEGVSFASRPGVYVTGSLYRPKRKSEGKFPAVLCPHGHWEDGRFYVAKDGDIADQLKSGGETYLAGAVSPLQSRMVHLARMGCTVFFYDMIGYADNTALPHREAFNDAQAELWSQNKMGLQTWNSIWAIDFLESLPDVDPSRIAVTGASGGGTQTFILCALDSRPAVAFPAVMVGTGMQGGCQCENASYLRVGINNVTIAALTAPRPMAMSGADDWTIDIETKGLPELKKVYGFSKKEELVAARCFPQFKHNYNEPAREMMYAWLARHLKLENVPLKQTDYWPLTREQQTIWNEKNPQPDDWMNSHDLRTAMAEESVQWMKGLTPDSEEKAKAYREIVGGALEVMLGPVTGDATNKPVVTEVSRNRTASYTLLKGTAGVKGQQLPLLLLEPAKGGKSEVVLWMDGQGKSHLLTDEGTPREAVQVLLDQGYSVASVDAFLTGESLVEGEQPAYSVNADFPGYTFCYNQPLISRRVRDVQAAFQALAQYKTTAGAVTAVHLVGTGEAGLWTLLARTQTGTERTGETIVDLEGRRFVDVWTADDPRLLPGALKFGDIDGLAAIAAPARLTIRGATGEWPQLKAMQKLTASRTTISEEGLQAEELLTLLKPAAK